MCTLTPCVMFLSLEKQRSGRLDTHSPVGSDSELELMGRVADLQEKFSQHR
jgi:hypothetical protein